MRFHISHVYMCGKLCFNIYQPQRITSTEMAELSYSFASHESNVTSNAHEEL